MSRRVRIDPETARLVDERLQWLLRENGPRAEVPGEAVPLGELDLPDLLDRPAEPTEAPRPGRRADRPPREPDHTANGGPVAALVAATAAFRRPHLVIVGLLVAVGILIAGWAVLRARPVAIAVTPPTAAAPATGTPGADSAGSTTPKTGGASPEPTAPSVVVHVLGAVKKPGLVTLTAGSRVQDALDAAGGLTGKADPGELNLAQQVADGQQIVVGTKGKPNGELRTGTGGGSTSGAASGGGTAGSSGQPVNLNTASQAELEELPGVGPVMAGKILAWRTEHGRFSRVEELQEIDGVGPKTYAKLAPLCQV